MKVLLQQVTIICPTSTHHKQVRDILIVDGIIKEISKKILAPKAKIIAGKKLHVSIGWMDIFADFAEPGNEHKETLETGANAAAAGGFTDVMVIPNTNPTIDTKSQVSFIVEKTKALSVNILPIGSVTKNIEGKALSEMYDMYNYGAVAFSDGKKPLQEAGVLLKALQYADAKNAVVIQMADDKTLSNGGLMHEGIMSTQLGLPGIPAIAEELMIARDIALLHYTNSALHITGVSTKKSVELIAAAKKEGLKITCSCTPYHLTFTDEDLIDYDTNLKVNPPLRNKKDVAALQKALANGIIDCVASHHNPQSWDEKTCEFEYAKNGMITLQTMFNTINVIIENTETVVKILTENNRKIFGINLSKIEEGAEASITLFEPTSEYIFEENHIKSISKNSPYIGKKLKGKVMGIINKKQVILQ